MSSTCDRCNKESYAYVYNFSGKFCWPCRQEIDALENVIKELPETQDLPAPLGYAKSPIHTPQGVRTFMEESTANAFADNVFDRLSYFRYIEK